MLIVVHSSARLRLTSGKSSVMPTSSQLRDLAILAAGLNEYVGLEANLRRCRCNISLLAVLHAWHVSSSLTELKRQSHGATFFGFSSERARFSKT